MNQNTNLPSPTESFLIRAHALVNGETRGHETTLSLYQYSDEPIEPWPANCANENVKTNGAKRLSVGLRNAARPGGESAAFPSAS